MANVQEAISQSELYLKLHSDRLNVLKQLSLLDAQLSKLDKGAIPVNSSPEIPLKKRGRPKGSKNKNGKAGKTQPKVAPVQAPAQAETPSDDGRKRFANKISLRKLIVKICGRHPSGIKLDELVKKCYEAGYRSTSGEKGFVQNIRTNLHSLMNKGVVIRDEDKKYHKQEAEVEAISEPAVL